MSWQPIDFQRIVALDKTLVAQLRKYLVEKETEFGNALLSSLIQISPNSPSIPSSRSLNIKLSEAVEGFGKKLRQILQSQNENLPPEAFKEITQNINHSFWEYEEVLEGCVKELFQQLDQIGIELWNSELAQVLDSIKDMLLHLLEDLVWGYRRINSQLIEFRSVQESRQGKWVFLNKITAPWRSALDRSLLKNLEQTEKYLKIHYKKQADQLKEYIGLDEKVLSIMKKLNGYQVLNTFDDETKKKFENLYYYVKLWKFNQKNKIIPVQELIRSLSYSISLENSIDLLKKYSEALKNALYHQSRVLKKKSIRYMQDPLGKKMVFEMIKGYRAELITLGSTTAKYREFLLRTDPNPYVRSRLGFTEWVVGPEPEQAKQLLNIEYEVDNLEKLFEKLEESIERGPSKEEHRRLRMTSEVQRLLHEMGQPLTSHSMAKRRAEYVLEHLKTVDELGSFNPYSMEYASKIFSKLLRADWKHHVVHEIPLFQELFSIHMGLVGGSLDRNHQNRMSKFRHLIQEIESWVKTRQTSKHEHDIELDMNDLKGYLQDFLAQVQRAAKDESITSENSAQIIAEFSHQLLIYRYLFGEFFYFLSKFNPDGKRIRNKLLFIDQYFESVENKLHVLRNMSWPSPS